MRIIVISRPASGHAKLGTLLSQIYVLKELNHTLNKLPGNDREFQKFVEIGKFTEAVYAFIRSTYGSYLKSSLQWMKLRKALLVRYEELIKNEEDVLKQLCGSILPVNDKQIAQVLSSSEKETRINEHYTHSRLSAGHLGEINYNFAPIINALGYKIRRDQDGELTLERLQGFARFIDEFSAKDRFFIVGRGKSGTT